MRLTFENLSCSLLTEDREFPFAESSSEFHLFLLPLFLSSPAHLPFSIRILLEAAIRNCDEFLVKKSDVENILNWKVMQHKSIEVPFKPARVILQDFT